VLSLTFTRWLPSLHKCKRKPLMFNPILPHPQHLSHGKATRCSLALCPVTTFLPRLSNFFRSCRFNIYIYDYCSKRGFRKTAKELLMEADLPPESTPPINARQGLLFEYVRSLSAGGIALMEIAIVDGGQSFGCYSRQRRMARVQKMR
jgi:hypothetical protein